MEKAVKNLDFMEAAKYRDLIIALEERIWSLAIGYWPLAIGFTTRSLSLSKRLALPSTSSGTIELTTFNKSVEFNDKFRYFLSITKLTFPLTY
jgi:hypothetical protein